MYKNITDLQDMGRKMDWPYPVNYGAENYSETDILILGGGLAGTAAAIEAAGRGATVALVDKGPISYSGSGGSGVDHWHEACGAPFCTVTPEQATQYFLNTPYWGGKFTMAHQRYISAVESYDALLELEKMGLPIRDEAGEFEGAAFRDPETKLTVAYDYEQAGVIRLKGGAKMKPLMKKECDRLGVHFFEHVSATSLLTRDGKTGPGATVIGATGVNLRTGEFYIWKAKAVLVATGIPQGLWVNSTEVNGGGSKHWDVNCVGEGQVIMARAGAQMTLMESNNTGIAGGPFRWPAYGVGDWSNTWYPCPIVDANGKKIPYIKNGKEVTEWSDFFDKTWPSPMKSTGANDRGGMAQLPSNLPELIKQGVYELPFYADMTQMDPQERRALWGLMIGNEGRTNYPVYKLYSRYGFDPEKDLLQLPIFTPDQALTKPSWMGTNVPQWRDSHRTSNCAVTDWHLKTTLDGLYAAGLMVANNYASGAHATGRYAARNMIQYINSLSEDHPLDRLQIETEKKRVYASVRRTDGIGWKEFKNGCCRVMQDHCTEYKTDKLLRQGIQWFESIRESEMPMLRARNPHELGKVLECYAQLECSEMTLYASLARKAGTKVFDFKRTDYPEFDPPEYDVFITVSCDENGNYITDKIPLDYYLQAPWESDFKSNYEKYASLDVRIKL